MRGNNFMVRVIDVSKETSKMHENRSLKMLGYETQLNIFNVKNPLCNSPWAAEDHSQALKACFCVYMGLLCFLGSKVGDITLTGKCNTPTVILLYTVHNPFM